MHITGRKQSFVRPKNECNYVHSLQTAVTNTQYTCVNLQFGVKRIKMKATIDISIYLQCGKLAMTGLRVYCSNWQFLVDDKHSTVIIVNQIENAEYLWNGESWTKNAYWTIYTN